jgi:hypothetical protein
MTRRHELEELIASGKEVVLATRPPHFEAPPEVPGTWFKQYNVPGT